MKKEQPKEESNHRLQGQSLPCYHYTIWLPQKTAYLHRPAEKLITFTFSKYEKFSIPKKCCIIINMSNVCGRGRTQTYKSVLATVSYQLNYSPLKIHLFSRTDVAFFLLLLTYFLFMFNMEILKEHRTDSNHRRTGICPTPSSTESTMLFICFVSYVRYHIFESHAY